MCPSIFNPRFIMEIAGTRYTSRFSISTGEDDAMVVTRAGAGCFATACELRRKLRFKHDLARSSERVDDTAVHHNYSQRCHDRARHYASIHRNWKLFRRKHKGFDRDGAVVLSASQHSNR